MNAQQSTTQIQSRRIALSLLALTLVIAAVGMWIHHHNQIKVSDPSTFENGTSRSETQAMASFAEFNNDYTIGYYDETVTPGETPAVDWPLPKPSETQTGTSGSLTSGSPSSEKSSVPGVTLHDFQTGEAYAYAYAGYTPQTANLDIPDWRLLLVNRNYMLPQDYSPTLAEAVKGTSVQMDARVAPFYQQMYDAAKADGVTLTPLSGHRRISTQKRNFENKIQYYMNQGYDKTTATQKAAQIILPPGTSEHNAGLCMDIISLDVEFEQTKAFEWLQNHAADYGFILRYPKGKESITEITYEPWHWRYVGVDNAKAMNARGLCLEEFVGAAR